jgi:protein TonB
MNGYKTGGDWTDVTSIGRNEVVFEGRHKAYGAYYIRQRYPNALLSAFLSGIVFIALCVFIPYALRNISHTLAATKPDVVITPTDVLLHRNIIVPPVTHTTIRPPRTPVNRFMPPVITRQPVDSAPPLNPNPHTVTTPNPTPGDSGGGDIQVPNPGGNPLPEPPDNTPRTWVSEMPKFPGGDIEGYIGSKIRYSPEDVQLGIQGTVYASFVIEKDGSVSNVKLLKGIYGGTDLDNEALKVLSEMPKWIPGKQDGHPVRIQYMIPIHFKLQ